MEPDGADIQRGDEGGVLGNTLGRTPMAKNWCFTWNGYSEGNQGSIIEWFGEAKYVFQEETGESGTEHLQGFVSFKKKRRAIDSCPWREIHWEICRNKKAAIEYCQKEETRTGEVYTNIRRNGALRTISVLYGWQEELVRSLEEEPDDRTVVWVWSLGGGVGKTAICKYIYRKMNAVYVKGRPRDAIYTIKSFIEENEGIWPKIVLIDMPRNSFVEYRTLEEIKDGLMYCGKYESSIIDMNSPHVVVFANYSPERGALSADRWDVREV